jgi:hypothetical protein
VAAIFLVALTVSLVAFLRRPTIIHPTCAFIDGANYCRLANGLRAIEPFNRRPLVPLVVRAMPASVTEDFRIVAGVSILFSAAASVVLANRIVRRLEIRDRRLIVVNATAVAAALFTAPGGLRLAVSVPVLADHGGMAAGLLWMLLFTSRSERARAVSVPVAVLAVCAREYWAAAVLLSAAVALLIRGRRAVSIANVSAAIAGLVIIRAIPAAAPSLFPGVPAYSELGIIRGLMSLRFGTASATVTTVWFLVFAVGLMPAVLLFRPPFRWLHSELSNGDTTATTVLLSAVTLLIVAPLGSSDTPRLAVPAGALLLVLSIPWLVAHRSLWASGVLLSLVTVILWQPAHHLIGSAVEYRSFYLPGQFELFVGRADPRASWKATRVAVAAVATIAAYLLTRFESRRLRRQPLPSVSGSTSSYTRARHR